MIDKGLLCSNSSITIFVSSYGPTCSFGSYRSGSSYGFVYLLSGGKIHDSTIHLIALTIYFQTRDGEYRSRSMYRGDPNDPYAYDDELMYPRSSRSLSRHRSRSRHRSYSQSGGMTPFPGQAYSASGSISTYPGQLTYQSYPGSQSAVPMGSYGSPYYPPGTPMTPSASIYGNPAGMGVSPSFSPSYSPSMPPGVASSYSSSLGVPSGYPRSRSSSFSYPQSPYGQAPYMGTPMSTSSLPVQIPGQTIVIHKSRRHKHRHHSRHGSRNSDGEY